MSDSSFAASWLALREPVDHRSRSDELTGILAAEGRQRGWSRVVDLGSGTGSNLRYLDPRLPWVESWTVLDQDGDLLGRVTEPRPGRELRRITGDIAREGLAAVAETELVTASALLDLVSDDWMAALVRACRAAGAGALFVLSYDGHIHLAPEEPEDAEVREAVNRHQERDKGVGAALGPAAASVAEELFRGAGYRTESVRSPWILEGPADAALARELTDGWVEAAAEVWSGDPARLRRWHARRRDQIHGGGFRIEVGHRDLLALPGS